MENSTTTGARKKKVMLVDDYEMVRRGLRDFIEMEPDLEVVAEAESSAEALERCAAEQPEIALIDLSLGEDSGLDLIKDLVVKFPALKMLVVSIHNEQLYAERVLRAGASGFITKDATQPQLIEAIRAVLGGNFYASAEIVQRLIRSGQQTASTSPLDALNDRELAIFERLGQGEDAASIAVALALSLKTIEAYIERIREKMGADSPADLAQRATEWVAG